MKIFISFIFSLLLCISVQAQIPVDTADLKNKINAWIVPNGNKQVSATQVNQLLNGITNLMSKYSLNSAYRVADTLFLTGPGLSTVKVTLNSGGAPTETDPSVPSAIKALNATDVTRWNGKADQFTVSGQLSLVANVLAVNNNAAAWNANKLQGRNIASTAPAVGQVLKWNGSTWAPAADDGTSGSALPVGGNTNQFLTKNSPDDGDAGWLTPTKNIVGLANVQNVDQTNAANVTAGIFDAARIPQLPASKILQSSAISGQVLKWNGSEWAPATDNNSGGSGLPTGGITNQLLIKNSTDDGDAGWLTPSKNLVGLSAVQNVDQTNAINVTAGVFNVARIPELPVSKLSQSSASSGQVLKWNGSEWAPGTDNNSGGGGLPAGGSTSQLLTKNSGSDGDAGWLTPTKNLVGLANVQNVDQTNAINVTSGVFDVARIPELPASKLGQSSASTGQVLKWNGSAWAPGTDNNSGGGGLPSGGSTNQVLIKSSTTDGDANWNTLTKSAVGLGNADNTADLSKPISTATQAALNIKPNNVQEAITYGNAATKQASFGGKFNLPQNRNTDWESNGLKPYQIEVIHEDSIFQASGEASGQLAITDYSNSAGGHSFHIRKARGTQNVPLSAQAGDRIMSFGNKAYVGELGRFSYSLTAIISAIKQDATATNLGADLTFEVNPMSSGFARDTALMLAPDGTPQFKKLRGSGNSIISADANGNLFRGGSGGGGGDMSTSASNSMSSSGAIFIPTLGTNSNFRVGYMEYQGASVNSSYMMENLYFDGTDFKRRTTGFSHLFAYGAGSFAYFGTAASGSAGSTASMLQRFGVSSAGIFKINNLAGNGTGVVIVDNDGNLGWGASAGGGGATINNNADNRLITGSGTAGTLEAESSANYSGGHLSIENSGASFITLNSNSSSLPFFRMQLDGATQAVFGTARTTNDLLTGTVARDFVIRAGNPAVTTSNIVFSNNGTDVSFKIPAAGLNDGTGVSKMVTVNNGVAALAAIPSGGSTGGDMYLANDNVLTGSIYTPFSGSTSSLRSGALEFQSQSISGSFITNNFYYDGSDYKYRATGAGQGLYFGATGLSIFTTPSGTGGTTASISQRLFLSNAGTLRVTGLAGNGDGVAKIDNNGDISWMATPAGGTGSSDLTGGAIKANLHIVQDADYTVASTDYIIIYKTLTTGRTLTLPDPALHTNRTLIIKHGGQISDVTLSRTVRQSSTTTTSTLTTNKAYTLISDGTEWWLATQ